jgi:hypothetical protein
MMWVSHETIYQSLFIQGRGELRGELHRCLRTGRAQQCLRNRLETRGRIPDMVMISERPAEAADGLPLHTTSGLRGILDVVNDSGGSSTISYPDVPVTTVSYP